MSEISEVQTEHKTHANRRPVPKVTRVVDRVSVSSAVRARDNRRYWIAVGISLAVLLALLTVGLYVTLL